MKSKRNEKGETVIINILPGPVGDFELARGGTVYVFQKTIDECKPTGGDLTILSFLQVDVSFTYPLGIHVFVFNCTFCKDSIILQFYKAISVFSTCNFSLWVRTFSSKNSVY